MGDPFDAYQRHAWVDGDGVENIPIHGFIHRRPLRVDVLRGMAATPLPYDVKVFNCTIYDNGEPDPKPAPLPWWFRLLVWMRIMVRKR